MQQQDLLSIEEKNFWIYCKKETEDPIAQSKKSPIHFSYFDNALSLSISIFVFFICGVPSGDIHLSNDDNAGK